MYYTYNMNTYIYLYIYINPPIGGYYVKAYQFKFENTFLATM